jgi:hypothetical protein
MKTIDTLVEDIEEVVKGNGGRLGSYDYPLPIRDYR